MIMANDSSPVKKKRYEKPSITDPETGRSGPRTNYGPVGTTGCSYGDIGSACVNGTIPSGPPGACNAGNTPNKLDCLAGTSAGRYCYNGTDAIKQCDLGTRVEGNCASGAQPAGRCNTGTDVL